MSATETLRVRGTVFVPTEKLDWQAPFPGQIEVERTDANEIRVLVEKLTGDDLETVGAVYLTDAEASRLAFMLGSVVLGVTV